MCESQAKNLAAAYSLKAVDKPFPSEWRLNNSKNPEEQTAVGSKCLRPFGTVVSDLWAPLCVRCLHTLCDNCRVYVAWPVLFFPLPPDWSQECDGLLMEDLFYRLSPLLKCVPILLKFSLQTGRVLKLPAL